MGLMLVSDIHPVPNPVMNYFDIIFIVKIKLLDTNGTVNEGGSLAIQVIVY